MLLAPEGAATCTCSFNYKTSLALIPVRRQESWGIYRQGPELRQGIGSAWKGAAKIVGRPAHFNVLRINLNAPGDHYDETTGGSFLAWPQVTRAGDGFVVLPVQGTDAAAGFRFNSDFTPVTGTQRPWIYSSGLIGEIELKIMGAEEKKHRAILHFMEPEQTRQGGRIFDVMIPNSVPFVESAEVLLYHQRVVYVPQPELAAISQREPNAIASGGTAIETATVRPEASACLYPQITIPLPACQAGGPV